MAGRATGLLGISTSEFFKLSPKEFYFALKAKTKREIEYMEYRTKRDYEISRFQAVLIINPQLKQKDQIKEPKDLVRFAWEEPPGQQTVDQMKRVLMGIARVRNRKDKSTNQLPKKIDNG